MSRYSQLQADRRHRLGYTTDKTQEICIMCLPSVAKEIILFTNLMKRMNFHEDNEAVLVDTSA